MRRRRQVENWDYMERFYQHCIFEHMRCDPEDHYFLLTEPPLNAPENREYTAEIMFETFNCAGLYIAVQEETFCAGLYIAVQAGAPRLCCDCDCAATVTVTVTRTMTATVTVTVLRLCEAQAVLALAPYRDCTVTVTVTMPTTVTVAVLRLRDCAGGAGAGGVADLQEARGGQHADRDGDRQWRRRDACDTGGGGVCDWQRHQEHPHRGQGPDSVHSAADARARRADAARGEPRRRPPGQGAVLLHRQRHRAGAPLQDKTCFTGINSKIVSTYEPKIMLTNSPA
eukprot:1178581-Prorocentrum_minimum.AAC.5